jgi:hypothetical protein
MLEIVLEITIPGQFSNPRISGLGNRPGFKILLLQLVLHDTDDTTILLHDIFS